MDDPSKRQRSDAPAPLADRVRAKAFARPGSYRHPRLWGSAGAVGGTWNLIAGAILSAVGVWWGVLLIAVAALQLWRAHRLLFGPLPERVRELERSRARVLDDADARLRRIEQDLHDGAQAQMVAVAMKLGLAKAHLAQAQLAQAHLDGVAGEGSGGDLERVRALVDAAHLGAKAAIAELRDLARGIHPPVLDEGLGAALRALAARSEVPVRLAVDLPGPLARTVETIAYFSVAELLTNVAKHSGARHATLEARQRPGLLTLRVGDDGVGGARVGAQGGLAGLVERVGAVDGTLRVESPRGGPTVVIAELPVPRLEAARVSVIPGDAETPCAS